MQHYGEDFPPLRQNVNREVSTVRSSDSLVRGATKKSPRKVKKAAQKEITTPLNKKVSPQAAKAEPIPSVFVAADILSSSSSSSPRKGFGYSVNEDTFYECITEDNRYIAFEVHERPERPVSKMAAEYDMYCSDSDGDSDYEDVTPLQITYKQVPYGCIINSNVFLTTHQWHTLVSIDDKTMLCAVCDLYTDHETYKKHLEKTAHECNLKKCPPLLKFDMSITRKIKSIYHCGVCNELFRTSEREIHYNNKMHEGNLLFAINKATDIMYYDNSDNKENEQAQGFDTNTSAENEGKDCYYFNANNINNQRVNNDNYNDNSDNYRANSDNYRANSDNYEEDNNLKFINYENNFDYADEFEYEEPEVPIAGISYAKMAKTPKVVVQKFIEVDLGNKKVKVRFDSYHMIIISKKMKNEFWCMVCKIYEHMKNKFIHCQNVKHTNKLVTFRVVDMYEDYFIRQVDTKLFHCGHCNNLQMIHDMEDHIETVHPRRARQTSETKHAAKDDKTGNKSKNPNAIKLVKNDTNMKTSESENVKKYFVKPGDGKVGFVQEFPAKNNINAGGVKTGDNFKMPAAPNVKATFNAASNVKPVVLNPNVKHFTGPNVFKVTQTPINFKAQSVAPVKNTFQNNNIPKNDLSAKINTQTYNVTSEHFDAISGRGSSRKAAAPVKDCQSNNQNSDMTNGGVANFDNNTRDVANFDTTNKLGSQNAVTTNRNVFYNFDTSKQIRKLENIAKNNQIIRNKETFEIAEEKIVIYPFECKMMVPILSYNVICMRPNDFYCGLCDILFAFNMIKEHLCDFKHIHFLQQTPFVKPFKYHLIRAIRDAFHCTICNRPINADKIMNHHNEAIHTAMLIKYLKYKPREATCEFEFTGARKAQGESVGYAMSNETEDLTLNQPNMSQQENLNKIPQFATQNNSTLPQNTFEQTFTQNVKPPQVSKVAQRVNDIAQEIPVYVPTNPEFLPNYGLNNRDSYNASNFLAPNSNPVAKNTYEISKNIAQEIPVYVATNPECLPNYGLNNTETSNKAGVSNFLPPNTVVTNTYDKPKNTFVAENNKMYTNVNMFDSNMTKPSTWSYRVDSDLIPEKLTRPVNTDNAFTKVVSTNTERTVNTFTQNVQANTDNKNVQAVTEKTTPVKHKLTHAMAKAVRYELQNKKLEKTAAETTLTFNAKYFDAKVTFNNSNINEDQDNSTNKQTIADFIARNPPSDNMAQQESGKKLAKTANNNIQEANNNNNFNNPNMVAKSLAPIMAAKPATPIMAAKPATPIMAAKPATPIMAAKPATPIMAAKPATPIMAAKPALVMVEKQSIPIVAAKDPKPIMVKEPHMAAKNTLPNMISFATKMNYSEPDENCQSDTEQIAQNDENGIQTSDVEENLDEEQESVFEDEEESLIEDDDDELIDESVDKTFESQGSDDASFDYEEYVYLNLKNTYIKISNAAYNTLVHIGDGSRYCFVCSEQVDYVELQKHVDSRSHIEKMDGYRFLDKYEHHLLRQNFLNYHCAICNVIVTRSQLKSHIEWPLHIEQNENTFRHDKTLKEIKGGVKHVAVSTTKEIIYLNEHEPPIKIFLNVNVTIKKLTDSDYYEAGSGNAMKVERMSKTDVVKNLPKKEPMTAKPKRLNKLIFVDGNVLKVSWENWHGVSLIKTGYKCNLCQRDLHESELDDHCAGEWHSYSLKKEIDKAWLPALIRTINESALNCIVCNTELPNKSHLVKEHVNGKKHVKNYDTLKCESEKDDTYNDCDEDVYNVD